MPLPYWMAPSTADAAPALLWTCASPPATALARMKPFIETKRNSTTKSRNDTTQAGDRHHRKADPKIEPPKAPASSIRLLPRRVTSRALMTLAAISPNTPEANTRPYCCGVKWW